MKRTGVYVGIGGTAAMGFYLHRKYRSALVNDMKLLRFAYRVAQFRSKFERQGKTVVDLFLQKVAENSHKPLILFEDCGYTYADVDKESNKIGNYLRRTGCLHQNDAVAIFMPNEPAFIYSFFGLEKLGIICSFINYNLRGKSLLHCIRICGARGILCCGDDEYIEAIIEILPDLKKSDIAVWFLGNIVHDLPVGMNAIQQHINKSSDAPVPIECRDKITLSHDAAYIYTSGTTGLPKACRLSHGRMLTTSYLMELYNLTADDVIYTSLPLYHSAGFGLGFLNSMRVGGTCVIARKFSASQFWDDVRRYRATVIQYIGEICRYLLAQPRRHEDGKYAHRLRLAMGNGLRPDIWEAFQSRFNIEHIGEVWGATEGNMIFCNLDGKMGTVGRYTPLFKLLTDGIHLIQCDIDNAEPMRDKDGKCIRVTPGEMGLMVVKITPTQIYEGYIGEAATEKKILRNVFKDGDTYFNTGDLIKIDKEGYVYFMDRLGDTFRWKGENVATTEVAETLNEFHGIMEANVYGVAVPGQDGRAGMAAIILDDDVDMLDFKKLYAYVNSRLPSYACPKFLRITNEICVTGTYKHTKNDLIRDGFDPDKVCDSMYLIDNVSKTYVPLNKNNHSSILKVASRL